MQHIVPIPFLTGVMNASTPRVNASVIDEFVILKRPEVWLVLGQPFRILLLTLLDIGFTFN
jgi:hypothetical protein